MHEGNETFRMIAEYTDTPQAQALIDELEKIIDEFNSGTILAALTYLLIREHVSMNMSDDEAICEPCSNLELTQLFQALREINHRLIEDIPKLSHEKKSEGDHNEE